MASLGLADTIGRAQTDDRGFFRTLATVMAIVQVSGFVVQLAMGRSSFGAPLIVDCGAGKSYLGFILYERFLKGADKGELLALESRPELVTRGQALAAPLDGFLDRDAQARQRHRGGLGPGEIGAVLRLAHQRLHDGGQSRVLFVV